MFAARAQNRKKKILSTIVSLFSVLQFFYIRTHTHTSLIWTSWLPRVLINWANSVRCAPSQTPTPLSATTMQQSKDFPLSFTELVLFYQTQSLSVSLYKIILTSSFFSLTNPLKPGSLSTCVTCSTHTQSLRC